jgi:hypothetical protein
MCSIKYSYDIIGPAAMKPFGNMFDEFFNKRFFAFDVQKLR